MSNTPSGQMAKRVKIKPGEIFPVYSKQGMFNATVLLICLIAAAIVPLRLKGGSKTML